MFGHILPLLHLLVFSGDVHCAETKLYCKKRPHNCSFLWTNKLKRDPRRWHHWYTPQFRLNRKYNGDTSFHVFSNWWILSIQESTCDQTWNGAWWRKSNSFRIFGPIVANVRYTLAITKVIFSNRLWQMYYSEFCFPPLKNGPSDTTLNVTLNLSETTLCWKIIINFNPHIKKRCYFCLHSQSSTYLI